jgi:lysophospholipase L1-like esterase
MEQRQPCQASGRYLSRDNTCLTPNRIFGTQLEPTNLSSLSNIFSKFILIGANDAALESERQYVPIDEFKKNLVTIITHPGITAHDPKIVLITPPPVDEIRKQEFDREDGGRPLSRATANSAKYSEAVRQVAREAPGVGLIDLHEALMNLATEMTVEDDVEVAAREYIEKALKGCVEAERPDLEKAARAKFDTTARHDAEEAARMELKLSAYPLGSFLNGKRGGLKTLLPDGLHMNGDAYRQFYKLIEASIREGRANLEHDDRDDYVLPDWKVLNPVRN